MQQDEETQVSYEQIAREVFGKEIESENSVVVESNDKVNEENEKMMKMLITKGIDFLESFESNDKWKEILGQSNVDAFYQVLHDDLNLLKHFQQQSDENDRDREEDQSRKLELDEMLTSLGRMYFQYDISYEAAQINHYKLRKYIEESARLAKPFQIEDMSAFVRDIIYSQCCGIFNLVSQDEMLLTDSIFENGRTLFQLVCEYGSPELIIWLATQYPILLKTLPENCNPVALNNFFRKFIKCATRDPNYLLNEFTTRFEWFRTELAYDVNYITLKSEEKVPTIVLVLCGANKSILNYLLSTDQFRLNVEQLSPYILSDIEAIVSLSSFEVFQCFVDNFIPSLPSLTTPDNNLLTTLLSNTSVTIDLDSKLNYVIERLQLRPPDDILNRFIVPANTARILASTNSDVIANVKPKQGRTVLMYACEYGTAPLVEYLVSVCPNAQNVDNNGRDAISYCTKYSRCDNALILLKQTDLQFTLDHLDQFVSSNAQFVSNELLINLLEEMINKSQLNVKDAAVFDRLATRPKLIKYLLTKGAVPTVSKYFMMLAEDDSSLTSALLEKASFDANIMNEHGESALQFCIRNQLENNVAYLIQSRKVNATEEDMFLICEFLDPNTAQQIVEMMNRISGVNPDAVNSRGETVTQILARRIDADDSSNNSSNCLIQ